MAGGRVNGGLNELNGLNGLDHHHDHHIRYIPLAYSSEDSHSSALALVTQIRPDWKDDEAEVEFVRFTDGITNTLLKAVHRRPGQSKDEADKEAILLRAYGHGTDVLIDRPRETQNHELLMRHGLAPALLARFENGMLYRFVRGTVAHPEDLRKPPVYRAVARGLALWHATVPCIPGPTGHSCKGLRASGGVAATDMTEADFQKAIDGVAPGKPSPNVWTVMQKWIFALPTETEAQRARQVELQGELRRLVDELSQRPGLGKNGLVFAHCDLLSGNVIVLPEGVEAVNGSGGGGRGKAAEPAVTFIDYEYATPSPAAFDIANHFAEWGGFDCDYSVLPTRAQRREFIAEYVGAYLAQARKEEDGKEGEEKGQIANGGQRQGRAGDEKEEEATTEQLLAEVDLFRGVPGFYWGIWALIQATISEIDFDYASYAEVRLGEYYAWRAEADGSRVRAGREMPLRERRWAEEE